MKYHQKVYVALVFPKEMRQCGAKKKKKKECLKENMTESATNLTKENLINPISSASLKQDKLREINA